MRWWGIDKTLLELFARHLLAADFAGNPMDRFRGVIDGRAHGPNQTPRLLGLYGGWYTIEFRPGESARVSVAFYLRHADVLCLNIQVRTFSTARTATSCWR
jgi:predicted metal-dependent hydrolase